MKRIRFSLLFAQLCIPTFMFAWGLEGHRIIGEIAQQHLTKKAQKQVVAVLGGSTVAMEANWGDFVKSDTAYRACSSWHYNNFEAGLDRATFDSLAMCQDRGEAVYRIYDLADRLRQNPNDTVALRFLIHIVGDIHCPMHMGRPDDRGGNKIKITWFGHDTNLHALWDDILIDGQKLSYTEYAAHIMRTQPVRYEKYEPAQVLDWAWQTVQNGNRIYDNTELTKRPYNYIFEFKDMWESSLMLGGLHLAALLNDIYK
ncbi:MAG: S1/P1 nuclease [Paludibacteraceae bacterium]